MFSLVKRFYPLNTGQQHVLLGAGGPQGVRDGRALGWSPWPYRTGVVKMFGNQPYGAASTLVRNTPWPYPTMAPYVNAPIGIQKRQTYTSVSF